jgi:hypothetical protein
MVGAATRPFVVVPGTVPLPVFVCAPAVSTRLALSSTFGAQILAFELLYLGARRSRKNAQTNQGAAMTKGEDRPRKAPNEKRTTSTELTMDELATVHGGQEEVHKSVGESDQKNGRS